VDWRGELIVLWFKVESAIVAHRKTRLIPRAAIEAPTRTAAMGVWLFAAAWSAQHESDGFVPGEEFERWDPNGDLTPFLLQVGYLEDATVGGERGYKLHDWLDVQRSRAEIEADRAEDAEKKRRMRAAKVKRGHVPPPDDDDPPGKSLVFRAEQSKRRTNYSPRRSASGRGYAAGAGRAGVRGVLRGVPPEEGAAGGGEGVREGPAAREPRGDHGRGSSVRGLLPS
jgi:hypothetical protein